MGILDIFNKKKDGEHITYWPGTNIIGERHNYKNGKLNGLSTHYYETGEKLVEGNNKEGFIDGKITIYSKKGIIIDEINYKNGLIHGKHNIFDFMGELFWVINFEDGKFIDFIEIKTCDDYDEDQFEVGFLQTNCNVIIHDIIDNESLNKDYYSDLVILTRDVGRYGFRKSIIDD